MRLAATRRAGGRGEGLPGTGRRPRRGAAGPAGRLAAGLLGATLAAACTPPSVFIPPPPPPPLPAPPQLIDAAVAAVGLEPIVLSEVRLACDLARLREAPSPVDPASLASCPPALEEETIDQLVNQTLILEDAVRFNIQVPPDAVEARLAALASKLAGPDGLERFLARHGIDRAVLRERLAREVLLGRYLDQRIGLLVFVTPDEVEAFFRANRQQFGGVDLAEAEPRIRAYLQRRKYRDALVDYVQSLRSRAEVRRLAPASGPRGS